jgi:transposase
MLIQQIASVVATEFAPVFVALELSRSKWLVGAGTPQKWAVRRHQVDGGDLNGLLALLSRVAAGEDKRSGLPVKVHVCFEAGRDGHWLYRALKSAGYDAYEIEPASVAGSGDRAKRKALSGPGPALDDLQPARPGRMLERRALVRTKRRA